ncbi:transposase [Mesonia sp.]|uniref:transposase n=1 Tax=Mesonia sp. TaxID=1960830 RepID=UPI003F9451C6
MKYEALVSDQFYHVYNRGNNKEDLFKEEKNYAYFLELVKKHILPIAELYSYCLLKNHFHLLIKTKVIEDESKITKAFSNLFNAYAKAINKNYNRSGSLFKDRFSRIKITDESYLKALLVYIHLNPQHHGFTSDFRNYSHSSYQSLISQKKTKLERQDCLALFEDLENFVYYHQFRSDEVGKLDDDLLLE